ncbi:MAG: LytR/AlgR family response regulator transcription factor [Cellulosilyticaceae bacterium]
MIKIAICDDSMQERKLLESYIQAYADKNGVECVMNTYESGEAMYEAFNQIPFDLIFLDIYMDQMTGIDLVKKIREVNDTTPIVFTTSSKEHALEAYHYRVFQYLIKPLQYEAVEQVLKESLKYITYYTNTQCMLPVADGYLKMDLSDIYYIESNVRKTIIHSVQGQHACSYNINTFEEKLKDKGFARCHRSFIVNLQQVQVLKVGEILLKNDETIYMSKYKQKEVKKQLLECYGGLV